MRRRASRLGLLALIVLLYAAPTLGAKDDPFPYVLLVDMDVTNEVSEVLRQDFEWALVAELEQEGCFREMIVRRPDEASDAGGLLLRVRLVDFEDELRSDLSVAERYSPDTAGGGKKLVTSYMAISLSIELRTRPDSVLVRDKKFKVGNTYRPILEEDPRETNRLQTIEQAARATRAWACKGSPKKLAKEIARAISGH